MRTEGKVSKVAICPRCKGFMLACHIDVLCKETEKEFTEFTNEGFEVKLETIEESRARKFASYSECSKGQCKTSKAKG